MGIFDINSLPIIYLLIGVLLVLVVILFIVLLVMNKPKKVEKQATEEQTISTNDQNDSSKNKIQNYGKFQTNLNKESIFDFMEFDEICDNMIVRKNKTQYVMVLQCNGVNYDLMSENEKVAVEEGFVNFLNILRFPIQLYVQSRTLNLRDIIEEYKSRVDNLQVEIEKIDEKILNAKAQGNRPLREKLEFEKRRKVNILEYGINITDYVEKMSSNKNVLQQKTYVIVSFYSAELGSNLDRYSKEEIYNMCFSELYTRCQNIASALGNSQISCSILDSEELSELLYIAYNRDEQELLQLSKALDSQYDALYSTGKDVLQKKQEQLDKEINIAAIDLATDSILRADKQKQQEELEMTLLSKERKIKEKASELLGNYENQLDRRVYQIAKENIDDYKTDETIAKEKELAEIKEAQKQLDSGSHKKIVKKKVIVKKKKLED